jgi:hypothetical protein
MAVASIPQRAQRGGLPAVSGAEDADGLIDGLVIRHLSEPELSVEPLLAQAIAAARALVA